MIVLKFGGKSLEAGIARQNAVEVIKKNYREQRAQGKAIAVVVSAIADTTDLLERAYEQKKAGTLRTALYDHLCSYYSPYHELVPIKQLLEELRQLLFEQRIEEITKAQVLAFGELLSIQVITQLLQEQSLNAKAIDARKFIRTADGAVDLTLADQLASLYFEHYDFTAIPVISGYIASNENGETVTLGRNGSNYSAALVANFLNASELQNWTNVDGIYTAKPDLVPDAQLIATMSFKEAHELANFGTHILHPRTIEPLIDKQIDLSIKNTCYPDRSGTTITATGGTKGIKAVSVLDDVALITIKGGGLMGRVGIDARIFKVLSQQNISVRLIAQASSERGIGFIVDQSDAQEAKEALELEFQTEMEKRWIDAIHLNREMAIIAIVGRHNYSLEKAISGLRRNKIWMHLISNSISGNHISLVVDAINIQKAVNIVHSQVFGVIKTINVFCLGKGVVGATLLDQILATPKELIEQRKLKINVVGVADSQRYHFDRNGIGAHWKADLAASPHSNAVPAMIKTLQEAFLENLVIADNTSSQEIVDRYPDFIEAGFDLVASNKKLNSGDWATYQKVQEQLKRKGRLFFYETNVGAGLPIIDTIKHLTQSADQITKIRGVFSGSLSYLFNTFSSTDQSFSDVLLDAKAKGYTEPDPREDLNGLDVARKLIILARETGLAARLEEVSVENLIPESLRALDTFDDVLARRTVLDTHYNQIKQALPKGHVLRYVGEMDVAQNLLKVALVPVSGDAALGSIQGADSIFEIYTEGYGTQPLVIQGAGAGGSVTARGVYSDLIRMGSNY